MSQIQLSNLETIPGTKITKHLGLVQGNTVRAKHLGRDILSGLKNIVGGELHAYTELLTESRQQSTSRMMDEARALGANAIICVRYSTSSVSPGASELYAYGTAVVVEPL
ncbi:MAG: YbjQ family protein [Robiginitomaculum sp.]|nr:YbjQ family protein [Robiginitomaculum sp.]